MYRERNTSLTIKVGLVSLGCAKNLVDSEIMLGLLAREGMEITPDARSADVLVVNTCGFIGEAQAESVETILELAQEKEKGRCRALVVTGCLAQEQKDALLQEIPEIDAVVGTGHFPEIVEVARRALAGERVVVHSDRRRADVTGLPRILATPPGTAYLKIAEGCDNACTFCAIPRFRGGFQSRTVEDLVREARDLAARGVRELILVAQDSSAFGRDLTPPSSLAHLLRRLSEVEGPAWIRVLYLYPRRVTEDLLAAMERSPRILPYFDIPLQHASDPVLRRMNRPERNRDIRALLNRIRNRFPDGVLRTTFIVGFPGETEEDVMAIEQLLEEDLLDYAGFFRFSPQEGTAAAALSGAVAEEVQEARLHRLQAVTAPRMARRRAALVGQDLEVLVDTSGHRGAIGRSWRDAPDQDGVVHIGGPAPVGSMMRVRITGSRGVDLIGERIL